MKFTSTSIDKKDGIRARRRDARPHLPLTATFTPQPPLTRPLEATTPPDLALEGPQYPRQADLGNWDHCRILHL
jgi:hypothetical protein